MSERTPAYGTDGKDTNPKDAIGVTKVPYHLIPQTALAHEAMAFLDGATKYGKYNWRVSGVRASIYIDAMLRHIADFLNGEDIAADSKVDHLAHVRACAGIIIDARECGMLTDDRAPRVDMHALHERLRPLVDEIKARNADMNPHQYTIADSRERA